MSLATTTGWWAVSTWSPVYAEQLAKAQGEMPGVWGPRIALVYTLGGVIAYMSSGFVADWIGRRAYLLVTFAGSLLAAPSANATFVLGTGNAGGSHDNVIINACSGRSRL